MALEENLLAVAEKSRDELAIEYQLNRQQARLFVRGIQTDWRVDDPIPWSDRESLSQFEDVRRLLHFAETFTTFEGTKTTGARDCYRRAGELLEWLCRLEADIDTIVPLPLLAAGAYQLSELPAMARSLIQRSRSRIDETRTNLIARFFEGDFDVVTREVAEYWRENENLTNRKGSLVLWDEKHKEDEDRYARFITSELVRCLGLAADALRRGNASRCELAITKLDALRRYATRAFREDAWILATMLRATAERFAAASLHYHIKSLAEDSDSLRRSLKRFACEQFTRGRGILWPTQIQGIEKLSNSLSFALCTPTGSGKTLIATLALARELLSQEIEEFGLSPLVLYLTPSRALAGEVEAKLSDELASIGNIAVTGLYGGTEWGVTDYWLNADRPTLLIATVEKADALVRFLGPLLFGRLKGIIVDEAHGVVPGDPDYTARQLAKHDERSIRLESFVTRLVTRMPGITRIALSAIAGGASPLVAQWIEGSSDAKPIGLRSRSMRQIIGALEIGSDGPYRISLDIMNGEQFALADDAEPPFIPLKFPSMPPVSTAVRDSVEYFCAISSLWTALNFRDSGFKSLISIAKSPERIIRRIAETLEQETWSAVAAFAPPDSGETAELFEGAISKCRDYFGEEAFELALLKHGIASNYGQMPQQLRRLMTALIEKGICSIAVATSTLTEGVNLPFDFIFVPTLLRSQYDTDKNQSVEVLISPAEFQNLAGRAGRPGATNQMEGMTLVTFPVSPSTKTKSKRATQARQQKQFQTRYKSKINEITKSDDVSGKLQGPLTILLLNIARLFLDGDLGESEEDFLRWLEITAPGDISSDVGTGGESKEIRLADSLDELDGWLLAATEELNGMGSGDISPEQREAELARLWKRTFSAVAEAEEDWLEKAFVKRGVAVPTKIYPDGEERGRLYRLGFTPAIGRRFTPVLGRIRKIIGDVSVEQYAKWSNKKQFRLFEVT